MADGFRNRAQGYIAYQDEEHGLAHQVAKDLRDVHQRTSPRKTASDTIAALLGRDASQAVVQLRNDIGGYDKRTLETLLDFDGYTIEGGTDKSDHYVLAVPKSQVLELGESNFPSAFTGGSIAVGNLPKDEPMRNMLRKRIDRVFASSDAFERCGAALDGYRAQGIDISMVPDGESPYRTVLREAEEGLDPDRIVRTTFHDGANSLERTSHSTGKNYAKPLTGVLIPFEEASLGQGDMAADRENGAVFDYIIVDDRLEGNRAIESRFLVLSKRKEYRPSGKVGSYTAMTNAWKALIENSFTQSLRGPDGRDPVTPHKYSRILFKMNSRGAKTKDTGIFEKRLLRRGFKFVPVVLNDRPEFLPVIYEIEVENDARQISRLMNVLHDARDAEKGWVPRFLGAYGTSETLDVVMPTAEADWEKYVLWAALPLIALVGLAAFFLTGGASGIASYLENRMAGPVVVLPPAQAESLPPATGGMPPVAEMTIPPVASCTDDSVNEPSLRFEVVQASPSAYWLCANDGLIARSTGGAQCAGGQSPETYAAMAEGKQDIEAHIRSVTANSTVRENLCDAEVIIVAGSASSSPYEKNEVLPGDRAGNLAAALRGSLSGACDQMPSIRELSLGVASCSLTAHDGTCLPEGDRAEDREILIVAGHLPEKAQSDVPLKLDEEISAWLHLTDAAGTSPSLLSRISDPDGFAVNQLVWSDDQSVAKITVHQEPVARGKPCAL